MGLAALDPPYLEMPFDRQHPFCARSGDGLTLVTEGEGGYDVWDLPLRPSLAPVLGPPLAGGVLLLLLERRGCGEGSGRL